MNQRNSFIKNILLLMAFSIVISCNQEPAANIPDVDKVDIGDPLFIRFDRKLAQMDPGPIKSSYEKLLKQHPVFTDLYFKRLLNFPQENMDTFYLYVADFIQADKIQLLQDTVDHFYSDTERIEDEFRSAFRYLRYYFPTTKVPNVYFFQSEFGYQTIIFSDVDTDGIGIGLDLFLGEDFEYKRVDPRNPAFSEYLTRTYNRDHIVRKTMALMLEDVLGEPNGKRFIDLAIHEGKKLYLLEKIMPYTHDTIRTEFSEQQWQWLQENELEMWSFFLEKELIYETNHLKIDKYINTSPHSPGMPPEAPGRTGAYIGLQMVKSYLKRYPDTKLRDLIELRDAQKLMELSKYKPKRR